MSEKLFKATESKGLLKEIDAFVFKIPETIGAVFQGVSRTLGSALMGLGTDMVKDSYDKLRENLETIWTKR